MVLQCLARIPALLIELVNSVVNKGRSTTNRPLPDDVTFDILRRLPPASVMNCRKVCKQWLAITSSPNFVNNMHRESISSTLLLVQNNSCWLPKLDELALLIFDEDAKQFKKMRGGWITVKEKKQAGLLMGCCNAKLVFRSWYQSERYYLCDLVTREKVIIEPPRASSFLGIFFHPLAKEYRLLFHCDVIKASRRYEIFIYGCHSKTWRSVVNIFSYRLHVDPKPVELNGNLHWVAQTGDENINGFPPCGNSIIVFNTDTEKFCSRRHPGRDCHRWREHMSMKLLEMERSLSFGKVCDKFISIWVLEDYHQNWSWVLRYKVDLLNWDVKGFPWRNTDWRMRSPLKIKLWNIKNGELTIAWLYRGLFRYHLEHDSIEKLDFPENSFCDGFLVSLALLH